MIADQWAKHTFKVDIGERYSIEITLRENLDVGPAVSEMIENLEQLTEAVRGGLTVRSR